MDAGEKRELYLSIWGRYGFEAQAGMLMEECAELIQITNKLIRHKDWSDLIDPFCGEIADVEIMIDQMKEVLSEFKINERVELHKKNKLKRTKERLMGELKQ